ncbi:MAG: aspartate-semialdehyde dehydrogenase [Candidatus Eisenbacteria bacterium]|nr:aspartate-semialdehyde dehydrogenase [Candidatus Eisenbacteria bacterium]
MTDAARGGGGVRVGVAGATGAVGLEMLRVLEDRSLPVSEIRAMASERGEGRAVSFAGRDVPVVTLSQESLAGLDIVLFATSAAVSREFVPVAASAGAVAIDNSREFRMDEDVPLIVPEVNPDALSSHGGVIANPNCSTIQIVLPLEALRRAAGLVRVVAATYQSVSGTGLAAIDELTVQSRAVLAGEPVVSEVYPTQIAFNCIPHIDDFEEDGSTREERKMVDETRKILAMPDLGVSVTCVRVPVFRSHAVALNVETERRIEPDDAREIIGAFPGVRVLDDPESAGYPTQINAEGGDDVWVGRIRTDSSVANALSMWVVADNLRKGAALNAVQIAELLLNGLSG